MYNVSSSAGLLRAHRRLRSRSGRGSAVSRTVVLLGLTSLFTDIASEMVVAVLPLYLVYVGGFSPLAIGVIDGIYQGATALMGLVSGYVGDRWRSHKQVAATGYGLSALCKLALALVGTAVSAIGVVVLADRAGKGIRTAPRDAMISLSTPEHELGTAFGVHRAMDTTGAMLGPLVAFAILAIAPLAFHELFVVSFCFAMIGFGILVMLVETDAALADAQPARPAGPRQAFGLMQARHFRALMIAGTALSLATVSDAFVFLALQRKLDLGNSLFPLLFVGSASTYMLLAVPVGRLADRIGRAKVLLGGYVLLLTVYALLLAPASGLLLAVGVLGLLGSYYAATDGVLAALASSIAPAEVRGSGLALVRTATSIASLCASLLFGLLWTVWSIDAAITCFGGALLIAMAVSAAVLVRHFDLRHA